MARDRIFQLEEDVQSLRARGPQVIERADPSSVAEATRLRDRASALEEEVRRAQRTAAEAREEVGRESIVGQVRHTIYTWDVPRWTRFCFEPLSIQWTDEVQQKASPVIASCLTARIVSKPENSLWMRVPCVIIAPHTA